MFNQKNTSICQIEPCTAHNAIWRRTCSGTLTSNSVEVLPRRAPSRASPMKANANRNFDRMREPRRHNNGPRLRQETSNVPHCCQRRCLVQRALLSAQATEWTQGEPPVDFEPNGYAANRLSRSGRRVTSKQLGIQKTYTSPQTMAVGLKRDAQPRNAAARMRQCHGESCRS